MTFDYYEWSGIFPWGGRRYPVWFRGVANETVYLTPNTMQQSFQVLLYSFAVKEFDVDKLAGILDKR